VGVTVRQKIKGGPWWVFLIHQGRRRSKLVGDRATAEAVARELRKRIAEGDFKLGSKKTFAEYAETWITVTVPATCKPSTERDYLAILDNHVLPAFGPKAVTEITRATVRDFLLGKIAEGISHSTVGHFKSVISGVLDRALDDETIQVNPAQRLGKIARKDETTDINPLTRGELVRLLDAFQKHYPGDYPLALTLARTGMRGGEALALQWGDIDFTGRFIAVQRGFSRGRIEIPKGARTRRVDMSQQLTDTLGALKAQRKEEALRKGWGEPREWVFITPQGTPLDLDNWRRRIFNKALEKAGLRRVRVHDLRHTFASLLIQDGVSLAYIRDQLGHYSISITVDTYGHLVPGANKEAVDALDDAPVRTLSAPDRQKGLNQKS
jgi:integrase